MKLFVIATADAAFREAWRHRWALLKALVVPAGVAAAAGVLVERHEGDLGWLIVCLAATVVASVLFAVACHRTVLLGEDSLPRRWPLWWSGREWRYVGWSLAIVVVLIPIMVVWIPLTGFLIKTLPRALTDLGDGKVFIWIVYAPIYYVGTRISLVLPAAAVDRRTQLGEAWRLSRGNGWRLAIALVIPGGLLSLFAWLLGLVFDAPEGVVLKVALATAYGILGAVTVTVVSVAYRTLSSNQGR